jgi:hypothetical protein
MKLDRIFTHTLNSYGLYAHQIRYAKRFGGGDTDVEQAPRYTPSQMALLDQLTNLLKGQLGQGVPSFPGTTVPPVSPLQEQAFGAVGGYGPMIGQTQNWFNQMMGMADPGMAGRSQELAGTTLEGMMQPYDPSGARDFWQTSFMEPALQGWQQDIMPAIKESYAARNAADSGALGRSLGRSGRDLMTNLSGQLGNILYSGEQAHLGRQQTGVNQLMQLAGLPSQLAAGAGQVGGMGLDIASLMANMGGVQRGIAGEPLAEEAGKWQYGQDYRNPWLSLLPTALGSSPYMPYQTESAPGLGYQMLPGLGSFLGSEQGWGMSKDLLGGIMGFAKEAAPYALAALPFI